MNGRTERKAKTMRELPTIENYGKYSSSNYGAHTLCVSVGPIDVYYSYTTVVAFRTPDAGLVVRHNEWGPTTGKHLNWIDGGSTERVKARRSREDFEQEWRQVEERYFRGVLDEVSTR